MPQKRISICTSCSVGSRRAMVVDANGDVALVTEYAFALNMGITFAFWGMKVWSILPGGTRICLAEERSSVVHSGLIDISLRHGMR